MLDNLDTSAQTLGQIYGLKTASGKVYDKNFPVPEVFESHAFLVGQTEAKPTKLTLFERETIDNFKD